jgi:hypothetical protein
MSAAEAEAEIFEAYGPVSVEERIAMAADIMEQARQLYASAWAQCPEIKIPHDPHLN